MNPFPSVRVVFTSPKIATCVAIFMVLAWSPPPGAVSSVASAQPQVIELHSFAERDATGIFDATALANLVASAPTILAAEEFQLDALAALFHAEDAPAPVVVLVDSAAGSRYTPVLVQDLVSSLNDLSGEKGSVAILDERDEDLRRAGYSIQRAGSGPRCHGTLPDPGWTGPTPIDGTSRTVRLSKSLSDPGTRLAVVARLSVAKGRMGPFVIDAALRCVDPESRKRALADPEFGARLASGPLLGGRIDLVIGDLIDVPLPAPQGGEAKGRAGSGKTAPSTWEAGEILAGKSLLAVEAIGWQIAASAARSRGAAPPQPHPILIAARRLGLTGATTGSVDWRKVAQ